MHVRRAILASIAIWPSTLFGMTCSEYNSIGPHVENLEDLRMTQISKEQIDVIRENTSLKAARVASLMVTPMAIKLKRIMSDNALLGELASGTSYLVRIECFKNPTNDFYETVSSQFEIVVEYIDQKRFQSQESASQSTTGTANTGNASASDEEA